MRNRKASKINCHRLSAGADPVLNQNTIQSGCTIGIDNVDGAATHLNLRIGRSAGRCGLSFDCDRQRENQGGNQHSQSARVWPGNHPSTCTCRCAAIIMRVMPRWILTFTSETDWPVFAEASSTLKPCIFTSLITSDCAGFSSDRSFSKVVAFWIAMP